MAESDKLNIDSIIARLLEVIVCYKDLVYLQREANLKYSFGFTAEAKGSSDALVVLCGPREEPHFSIRLGADTNRSVRISCASDESLMAETECAGIVDSGAYRGFWLTWRDNSLSVGRGYRPGNQEIASLPMQGEESSFRPYCVKAACEAPHGSIAWRSVTLLYDD